MSKTRIEWTEETWNPVGGCRRKSTGCERCYAERVAHKLGRNPATPRYAGLTQITNGSPHWTGEVFIDEKVLLEPLRRRKPTTYFISLSDLFYGRPDEHIDLVFAVMALCPQHRFLILTKYPERMQRWFKRLTEIAEKHRPNTVCKTFSESDVLNLFWMHWRMGMGPAFPHGPWPLPNVMLGVSVENQQYADERIPQLLNTPAAGRFVSYEPGLGEVDFRRLYGGITMNGFADVVLDSLAGRYDAAWKGRESHIAFDAGTCASLDWVIVGGESGPGARPFDIQWARDTVRQCKDAGVPCFVKQLGSNVQADVTEFPHVDWATPGHTFGLISKKGGDMSEWPEDLRVREFPDFNKPVVQP